MRLLQLFVFGVVAVVSGCASAPKPGAELSESQRQFMLQGNQSVAAAMVGLAGYPDLIPDSSYSQTLDAAVTGGTMALLLPKDVPGLSSLAAGGLGFSISMLKGTDPVNPGFAWVLFQEIKPGDDPSSPSFIAKALKEKLNIGKPGDKVTGSYRKALLAANINDVSCEGYSSMINSAGYTHECPLPPIRWAAMVRVGNVYDGEAFDAVMPSLKGKKKAVIFVNSGQFEVKPNVDSAFLYIKGTLTSGHAVLPFVKPNKEGKRLVFIEGKATFI